MIFYFSGTGNSKWVAEKIGEQTGETHDGKVINIADVMKPLYAEEKEKNNLTDLVNGLEEGESVGIVFPIYGWDVPWLVKSFVKRLNLSEKVYSYVICTCGSEAGNAIDKLQGYHRVDSAYSIVMPDNYIVLFNIDEPDDIRSRIENAEKRIQTIGRNIIQREKVFQVDKGSMPGIKSSIVAGFFNKFFMSTNKFAVNQSCVGCGLCESNCPVLVIEMNEGKPRWVKDRCTMCLACVHRCPESAINYGNFTKKKDRYKIEDWL